MEILTDLLRAEGAHRHAASIRYGMSVYRRQNLALSVYGYMFYLLVTTASLKFLSARTGTLPIARKPHKTIRLTIILVGSHLRRRSTLKERSGKECDLRNDRSSVAARQDRPCASDYHRKDETQ
jgi:hypothetical protein